MKVEICHTDGKKGFKKTNVTGHIEVHRPFQGYDHNPKEEEDLVAVCVMDEISSYFPVIIKLDEFEARMLAGEILKAKRYGKGKLNAKVMGQHVATVEQTSG